jgi:hypothetical protein
MASGRGPDAENEAPSEQGTPASGPSTGSHVITARPEALAHVSLPRPPKKVGMAATVRLSVAGAAENSRF